MGNRTNDYDDRFDEINDQFISVDERLDEVDKRFARIDERFEEVDGRLARIDQRLDEIDQRFVKIDERFTEVDRRFDGIEKQLDKIVSTIVKGFDRINKASDIKANKIDLNRALDALDNVIKRQEICDQERLVILHQLERHDRWSHEISGKIGYELSAA